MMLKICRLLPDIYIIITCIGSCFAGAREVSQAFLSLRVAVSEALGWGRVMGFFCCLVSFVSLNSLKRGRDGVVGLKMDWEFGEQTSDLLDFEDEGVVL